MFNESSKTGKFLPKGPGTALSVPEPDQHVFVCSKFQKCVSDTVEILLTAKFCQFYRKQHN